MVKAELGVRDKGLAPVEARLDARSRLLGLRVYPLHVLCLAVEPVMLPAFAGNQGQRGDRRHAGAQRERRRGPGDAR